MDAIENTINQYPFLKFDFRPFPNDHGGGALLDDEVVINSNLNKKKQFQWLNEEIAHYKTTVGNILDTSKPENRKQECLAHSVALETAVSLEKLIDCYNIGAWTYEEVADQLNVEVDYLVEAIAHWRDKLGLQFQRGDYWFDLRSGLTIEKTEE